MSAQFACFVTGTDTEIGKTLISSALVHALCQTGLKAVGMKPVAAGASLQDGVWHNDDVDRLAQASNLHLPQALTAPYLLRQATAPHIAAKQEGVSIEIAHILDCYGQLLRLAEAVVVEGVGGFRVPLSDGADTADLAQRLDLPVILVVGLRLGCLNHALLTVDEIAARGLVLAGWVANVVDIGMPYLEDNIEALEARINAPLLGRVPRLALPSAAEAAMHLDFSVLPGWPKLD
ncbi:MAG: dethiobiotin synthase [Pseudomonadota bacterium]